MKKSLLIASLAVISMNVLGMNPLENNNQNGNNFRYILTPDSSPHRNSTNNEGNLRYLDLVVQQCISGKLTQNQRNTLIKRMYQQILKQNQTIESKNKENEYLSEENYQFACDVNKKDHEINSLYEQLDILKAEKHGLENRVRQYEEFCSDLESFISSRKPSSTFQPSDTEHVNSLDALDTLVQVALSDERTAESNQSRLDSDEWSESNKKENINQNILTEVGKDSTTPVNLENDSDVEYRDELTNNSENSDEDYTESQVSKTSENINQNILTEVEKDSTTPVNLENDSDVEYRDELTNNPENSDEDYTESQVSKTSENPRKLPSSERTFAKSKKQDWEIVENPSAAVSQEMSDKK